ncbi:MAG TPA: serine hydrolase [Patescibacteria group bacterium]|nr:serine hydrolase [Patescibacteria group bacterium]
MAKNKSKRHKKVFRIRKRYLLLLTLLIVGGFCIFSRDKAYSSASAKIFYGESFMKENGSETKLSSVDSVEIPFQKEGANEHVAIKAQTYIAADRATMTPLLEKDAGKKVQIASITKLMTAVITVENSKLDDVVTINSTFKDAPDGRMGLYVTEKITVENILNGLLISSSNDAAEALAYYIGKGNYKSFIQMMNTKAAEIGMSNTRFSNAMGLDNGENYSTPQDLVYLANYALKNEFIAKTVKTQEKRVKNIEGTSTHYLKTTDELLADKDFEFLGLKTGSTPEAGECLLSFAKTKNGHEIITVVLGSMDRFGETKEIVKWVDANITWE